MEKFIILSIPRTGSTLLTRTLDQHPDIFCAGELFNTDDNIHHPLWHFPSWGFKTKNHLIQRINRIIDYPNHRFRCIPHIESFYNGNEKNEKTRGFKLMLSNIKHAPYLWQYAKTENIKVIVLVRKNVFKTILSRYRKNKNRLPHINAGKALETHFHVQVEKLIRQMKELEMVNMHLLKYSAGMNRLIIYYEDLFNWDDTINKLQTFLSVRSIVLPQALKKVSPEQWQDEVENYKEIEEVFQKNGLTKYFD